MRKFTKDSPEFFVFQIEGDSKTFKIPLAACMTNKQILEFGEIGDDYFEQIKWLKKFIGKAVDDLTPAETAAILRAWADESKDHGASVGES